MDRGVVGYSSWGCKESDTRKQQQQFNKQEPLKLLYNLKAFKGYLEMLRKFIYFSVLIFPYSLVKALIHSFIQNLHVEHKLCSSVMLCAECLVNKTTSWAYIFLWRSGKMMEEGFMEELRFKE